MALPTSPTPNHVIETKREYLVDKTTAEDGTEYTRLRNTKLLRTWKLEYSQIDATAQTTMNAWFAGLYGSYQTDTVTHAQIGTSVKVRITNYTYSPGAYPRQNLTVTLEETP